MGSPAKMSTTTSHETELTSVALPMTGSITASKALLVGRAASFPIIIPFFVLEALLEIEGNPA